MVSLKPQFHLSASWSRAGVGTCMVINMNKIGNQRIAFDIGSTPIFDEAISAKYVFISHGHLDHIGGLFSHARAHSLTFSTTPTYYVPKPLVSKLEKAREAMSELDSATLSPNDTDQIRSKSLMKMTIIGIEPGDEFTFKPKKCGTIFVRTFAVDHGGHPSIGYILGRIVPGGLLPEYQDISSREIGKLVKSGINVKANPQKVLEVTYTGDTCSKGLILKLPPQNQEHGQNSQDNNQRRNKYLNQAFQAPLIICELTFLESMNEKSIRQAQTSGHLHIDDIPEILASHGWEMEENKISSRLVLYHLSLRYRPVHRALTLILDGLPSVLWKNVDVAISSFMSDGTKDENVLKCIKDNGCISLYDYSSLSNNTKKESS